MCHNYPENTFERYENCMQNYFWIPWGKLILLHNSLGETSEYSLDEIILYVNQNIYCNLRNDLLFGLFNCRTSSCRNKFIILVRLIMGNQLDVDIRIYKVE